jgi:hypothetical protein
LICDRSCPNAGTKWKTWPIWRVTPRSARVFASDKGVGLASCQPSSGAPRGARRTKVDSCRSNCVHKRAIVVPVSGENCRAACFFIRTVRLIRFICFTVHGHRLLSLYTEQGTIPETLSDSCVQIVFSEERGTFGIGCCCATLYLLIHWRVKRRAPGVRKCLTTVPFENRGCCQTNCLEGN